MTLLLVFFITLTLIYQDLMLSLPTLLNEQGLNGNRDPSSVLSIPRGDCFKSGLSPTWGSLFSRRQHCQKPCESAVCPKTEVEETAQSWCCKCNALENSAPRQLTTHVQFTTPWCLPSVANHSQPSPALLPLMWPFSL